ncbi:hypothetical protein WN944_014886 [Citrus x changshan-huyou]|uniref:Uncharacterized protein n=1 Tax=Citrus x changshan-huyou TaxID=2935761 RepID=A0AAP0M7S2_9ROSI
MLAVFPICRLSVEFPASLPSMAWFITVITPYSRFLLLLSDGAGSISICCNKGRFFHRDNGVLFSQHNTSTTFFSPYFRENILKSRKWLSPNNSSSYLIKFNIEPSQELEDSLIIDSLSVVFKIFHALPLVVVE